MNFEEKRDDIISYEKESIDYGRLCHSIENNGIRFEIRKQENGDLVRIRNKESKWFIFNDLLPTGYKFNFGNTENIGGFCEISLDNKIIGISDKDLGEKGWTILLSILHEIGHAFRYETNKEEVEQLWQLKKSNEKNVKIYSELNKLISKDERSAWSYAINKLRFIESELGIKAEDIYLQTTELERLIQSQLATYRESAGWQILSDEEMRVKEIDKLVKEISSLYNSESGFKKKYLVSDPLKDEFYMRKLDERKRKIK